MKTVINYKQQNPLQGPSSENSMYESQQGPADPWAPKLPTAAGSEQPHTSGASPRIAAMTTLQMASNLPCVLAEAGSTGNLTLTGLHGTSNQGASLIGKIPGAGEYGKASFHPYFGEINTQHKYKMVAQRSWAATQKVRCPPKQRLSHLTSHTYLLRKGLPFRRRGFVLCN